MQASTQQGKLKYMVSTSNFKKIPGSPIAYWASQRAIKAYEYENLDTVAKPRHGLATSDNNRFLKIWFEVLINNISFNCTEKEKRKWFPIDKGGAYRKWYGNFEWVINYENDGKEIKDYAISIYKSSSRTIQNTKYYFKKGLTWSAMTSSSFSVRLSPKGALFGSGGYKAFVNDEMIFYILALMNSAVTQKFTEFVSPTLNYEVGHIKTIPVIVCGVTKIIDSLVKGNICVSQTDWDSFETSWDFKKHPLL